MKSTEKQLEARGFVSSEELAYHKNKTYHEIITLLESDKAQYRTIGAKLSEGRDKEIFLPILCKLLQSEKKLYTKIAISEAIESYGDDSIEYLIPLLGKIGSNHHKKPALVDLNKKSFPLPRDISARILIRIGENALDSLEKILIYGDYIQKAEAIDAIGHIAFNSKNIRSEKVLLSMLYTFEKNELITWKIIRALRSFSSDETRNYLKNVIEQNTDTICVTEAERSLNQIENKMRYL